MDGQVCAGRVAQVRGGSGGIGRGERTVGVMKVCGLWRYPVKSMIGEQQGSLELRPRGVEGDRLFGVLDLATGVILAAKKEPRLLEARALLAGVTLTVRLPTGETPLGTGVAVDRALSGWLGRPVRLVEVPAEGRGTYEMPSDYEDDESESHRWEGPVGSFVDSGPVHVLTTASLRAMVAERPDLDWDVARFRPNIVVEAGGQTAVEQAWVGRRLVFGDVVLEVDMPCRRCVMTTRPQPPAIERQLDILRHIHAHHRSNLGVLATVVRGGRIEGGQVLEVDC